MNKTLPSILMILMPLALACHKSKDKDKDTQPPPQPPQPISEGVWKESSEKLEIVKYPGFEPGKTILYFRFLKKDLGPEQLNELAVMKAEKKSGSCPTDQPHTIMKVYDKDGTSRTYSTEPEECQNGETVLTIAEEPLEALTDTSGPCPTVMKSTISGNLTVPKELGEEQIEIRSFGMPNPTVMDHVEIKRVSDNQVNYAVYGSAGNRTLEIHANGKKVVDEPLIIYRGVCFPDTEKRDYTIDPQD